VPYLTTKRIPLSNPDYYVDIDTELRVRNSVSLSAMSGLDESDTEGRFNALRKLAFGQSVAWNITGAHRVTPEDGCQVRHQDNEVWPLDSEHFQMLAVNDLTLVVTAINDSLPKDPTAEEAQDFPYASSSGPEAVETPQQG